MTLLLARSDNAHLGERYGLKNIKHCWAQQGPPVIPTTQEAEARLQVLGQPP